MAEKRKESVQVIGEELGVCNGSVAARVDLNNARVEAKQAECSAGMTKETVRSCSDSAQ